MNLKLYFEKIRDTESQITETFPIVVSKDTEDGGKAGRYTEVTRAIAAKMITENRARLATLDEAKAYREALAEAKRLAEDSADAARVQFSVISAAEMAKLTGAKKDKA
jgi:Putative phage tail protein